ncbi:MAG: hypothetical protein H7Y22_11685 [Gemmatimonadaceae bacterium]|nr:hypothetical protein [Gloeobacterales cyanobacterium ES-bin-141]
MYPTEAQIQAWQDEARCRYPDFDLVLQLRLTRGAAEYSLHFQSRSGTCAEQIELLFPLEPIWYPIDLFWREDSKTEVDFIFSLYPDRASLTKARDSGLQPATWLKVASRVGEIFVFYCCCRSGLVAVIGLIIGLASVGSWIGAPTLWMIAALLIVFAAFYGPFYLAAMMRSRRMPGRKPSLFS